MSNPPDAPAEDPSSGALLAVDWGTSNLRAWKLSADGKVLDARHFPWGVAGLAAGEAARKLQQEVRPALGAQALPAILCGMVGSALGIAAAPYLNCPADAQAAARTLLRVDARTFIVPGLKCRRADGYPDVIRGEETKVFGWLALDEARRRGVHVLCLPGTHCKWVTVRDGKVEGFLTAMTGELFSVLSQHSVLNPGAAPGDDASFAEGLKMGAEGGALAMRLFTVRSRRVGDGLEPAKAASYLSGLLIGDETASVPGVLGLAAGATINLMGEPALCQLYEPALAARGFKVEPADAEQAVIAGLSALHRMKAKP